jgi:hypothetical protein
MAEWPTHEEVTALLRLPDPSADDEVIEAARVAAIDYCVGRIDPNLVGWASTDDPLVSPVPDGVHEAALLLSARLYRRRDSLDGTIGWGEMGVVRVGLSDPDVVALLGRYLAVVIG